MRRVLAGLFGVIALLFALQLHADFEFIFFNDVFKEVVVDPDATARELERLRAVDHLRVSVQGRSNLLPAAFIDRLNVALPDAPKAVWLRSPVKPEHVPRLRALRGRLSLYLDLRDAGVTASDLREIERVGPVHIVAVLGPSFDDATLASLAGLRNHEVLVEAPPGGLDAAPIARLAALGKMRKSVVLGPDAPPAAVDALLPLAPLRLVVRARGNRLAEPLAARLATLPEGVGLEIAVDRTLTRPDLKPLSRFRSFDVRVERAEPYRISDELATLLALMKPPGR
jgi:hypothetical protein